MSTNLMSTSNRPYPRGVRPHFFEAAERRRNLEDSVFGAIRNAGYREVILPVIDASEPYRDVVDEGRRRRSYRFIDREGELLEVRSDFTPMVARALAPMISTLELPLRVSYRGDVVRCEGGRLSDDGEFYQIGAELLGLPQPEGDAEIVALAVSAAREGGVRPTLVISDERLIGRVIGTEGVHASARLRRAISAKHFDEVERLAAVLGSERRELLLRICSGVATNDDLRDGGLADVLDTMENGAAAAQGVLVQFACDEIEPEESYYTGLRFKIFDESGRVEIGRGGRYDELYGQFGASVSAVGFTLSLDRMEGLQ